MSFSEPLANPYLGTIVKANDRVCFVIDKLDVDDAAVRKLEAQLPLDLLTFCSHSDVESGPHRTSGPKTLHPPINTTAQSAASVYRERARSRFLKDVSPDTTRA
jgi:hypothetical protein